MAITVRAPNRADRPARRGAAAAVGLSPAVVPLGVALGVALAETSAPKVVAWATAPLMIAGAAQLALVSELDRGSTVLSAVLAALLLNGRFVVYGAAVAGRFADQPRWFRWLGPWFVVDQSYALVNARLDESTSADEFRRFYLGAALLLTAFWTVSVGAGILLGPVMPPALPVEFVLAPMFVALVVPGLRGPSEIAAALLGALAASIWSSTSSLALAVAGGLCAGATVRSAVR